MNLSMNLLIKLFCGFQICQTIQIFNSGYFRIQACKNDLNIFIYKGEMIMRNEAFTVSLTKNPSITMKVIPGHFTTNHFHISHYLGLNNLKTNASLARDVARELALLLRLLF